MKENILKWSALTVKGLSLFTGLAAYNNMIPAKWLPYAALAFGVASILKDVVNRIGDLVDDGVENGSFNK